MLCTGLYLCMLTHTILQYHSWVGTYSLLFLQKFPNVSCGHVVQNKHTIHDTIVWPFPCNAMHNMRHIWKIFAATTNDTNHNVLFANRTVRHLRGEPRLRQEKPRTGCQIWDKCYIECIHHNVYSGCTIGKVTGFKTIR